MECVITGSQPQTNYSIPVSHNPYEGQVEVSFASEGRAIKVAMDTDDLYMRSVIAEDVGNYKALFGNPEVMKTYAAGRPVAPDRIEHRIINSWIPRLQGGDPYSALAVFDRHKEKEDAFVGHAVLGYGEHLAFDEQRNAGYSEIAYLELPTCWNQGYGKQIVAALTKGLAPECKKRQYLVQTSFADRETQALPLSWISATARIDKDTAGQAINPASVKILTGLGFRCFNHEEKYGHLRGFFGLEV